SMEIVQEDSYILHVTSNGYGKQTAESEYRKINRGGKGVYTCRLSEKTGEVVAVKAVTGEEDLMLITIAGVLIRIPVEEISQTGRNAMGVHLIRLGENEEVATVSKVEKEEEEEIEAEELEEEDKQQEDDEK